MLSRIPDSIDKREGSIIFDALAPAAYELEDYYVKLNEAYLNTFVDTAVGAALEMRAGELGIMRNSAVKAVRKGVFKDSDDIPADIPIGSRFSTIDGDDSLNFIVREKLSDGIFRLECEQMGSAGNDYIGDLMAISPVSGLGSAELTDIIVPGKEIETDDELRGRIKQYVRSVAQDGNVAQYYEWAANFSGIGRAKVFPLWDGVNTVKVSILNSLFQPADSTLVEDFQDYLDPSDHESFSGDGIAKVFTLAAAAKPTWLNLITVDGVRMDPDTDYVYDAVDGTITFTNEPADGAVIKARYRGGLGNGIAPIGAIVTVSTATNKTIDISATITLTNGYTQEQADTEIEALLEAHFSNIAYVKNKVNYIEIGALLLTAESIDGVADLLVNSEMADIALAAEEIPVVGTITLTEAV